jgi:hypothetical protein
MLRPRFRALAILLLLALGLAAGCGGEERAAEPPTGTPAPRLELPYDVEVDGAGRIYVADGLLHQVLLLDPATGEVVVVAGTGEAGSDGDGGPATAARINEPVGLALASDGTLFIADFAEHRIRRLDADGKISTLAGTGEDGRSGDGGSAAAAGVGRPAEVVLDLEGRYLAVPTLGSVMRRIDLRSGRIETIAGDGTPETTGEGGPAEQAHVETPHGAAYDARGHLYFQDGHYIRKIDARTGVITTIAGNGREEVTGDGGPAREAGIDAVKLLFAPDGSLYLVGGNPDGGTIRRISPDGTIETVVGTGRLGPNGDGGPALKAGILPSDVALAADGALIVSQGEPVPAVRRVDPDTGVITTLLR